MSIRNRLPATLATERLVLTAPTLAHAPMAHFPFPYGEHVLTWLDHAAWQAAEDRRCA